jgi:two-component system, chemotaxis family, protein-glutamate methylesterase/glutaminase
MASKLKVLIVDDSPTARLLMTCLIKDTPDMYVVGEAHNGKQAVWMTRDLRPDVILMDIVMPGMDGLQATREIMSATPTPIVMIGASLDSNETDVAFQAIRLGALCVVKKPVGPTHASYSTQVAALMNTVRAMAEVRVIHHRTHDTTTDQQKAGIPASPAEFKRPEIVAIVSSTGGPAALSEIFKGLPVGFALPVVVVQHISSEFLPSLVKWLGTTTSLPVEIAQAGNRPQAGHIYFAPADAHLRLSNRRQFELDQLAKAPYRPSGDILLESIATHYGANAIGVILTGMGNDGAKGLQALYNAGAYTIAQDEATSVVFGMPYEAIAMGAVQTVTSIQAIARTIVKYHSSTMGMPTQPWD